MYPPLRLHDMPLHRRILASALQTAPSTQRIWNALTLRNLIVLVWAYVLYWGERKVYRDSLEECQWDKWEQWVRANQSITIMPISELGGGQSGVLLNWAR